MMATSKKRIEWIDLAKGICIFLVVFRHVSVALDIDYPLQTQFASFRMPLYFILSGLFFKQYEGFAGFLKRKTNKLLIPFLFFLITTSVIPFAVINHESSLKLFFTDMNGPVYNFAIWFLLCLFEINILFYLIQLTAARLVPEHQTAAVLVLCLLLGCCGLALGVAQVKNLFYLCTMLTALPFFTFGWWLRRHTSFLNQPFNPKTDVPLLAVCALIVATCSYRVVYAFNEIPREGVPFIYLCGIAGTLMVLTVSKLIKRLPLVSFWGRYSIIILCTHQVVVFVTETILMRYLSGIPLFVAVLVSTLLICHLSILFMKKYMPHVTAQKDVIKV